MSQIVKVGRRKNAIARVFLNEAGTGKLEVNKRAFDNYFPTELLRLKVLEPFNVLEINPSQYDIAINVNGGGITGQAEAVRLGLTRALIETNEEYRSPLKKEGLVTRDARIVERKKYGKRKARKSKQFSKR
ncbi:30S ribosomal protein S9 [Pontibacter sp. G13]|uniref:30S ribosomal protein S9 n=1 Tax=Pontibacter sp. G13 TaxID=3074898 RepID=UPI0028892D7F|nr:30S ribosomal protein S9 [Pontibacter sp. G13]WNJ16962.1 30S ribosomal protein S9 [Pontibacter sp. G13]